MSQRVQRLWFLLVVALVLTGCKPLKGIFTTDGTPPVVPDVSGEPPAGPSPPPVPAPNPNPVPGVLSVVVEVANLVIVEGATGEAPVRLSEAPGSDATVEIAFTANDGSILLESSDTLVFTPQDWNTAQNVRFTAVQDDDADDGVAIVRVRLQGANSVSFPVSASDDDEPANNGVKLTVKESSGFGVTDHPVLAVIPLEYGKFQTTDSFRIRDGADNPVPAQFDVLNRWAAKDNSIRHVVAKFQASVVPNGKKVFFFKTEGGQDAAPAHPVQVTETGNTITVDTGTLRFSILKNGHNLFNEVHYDQNGDGIYAASERIVAPGSEGPVFTGRLAGDVQRARDRTNISVVIEEAGPMRAMIRIESLGRFTSKEDHDHGFAIRMIAYAGQSFVKVDYQLQNSAKNVRFSWPLYFEDVSLNVKPLFSQPGVRLGLRDGQTWAGAKGHYLFQSSLIDSSVHTASGTLLANAVVARKGESSYAWADVTENNLGMAVMVRNMAQMWPNGVEVEGDGNVAVRLWPKWSAQFYNREISSTGLYWIEDMQHVLKETLFYFHGPEAGDAELDAVAKNFQYHPIANVPLDEYRRAQATFDHGSVVPPAALIHLYDNDDYSQPYYKDGIGQLDENDSLYAFAWMNHGGDTRRKRANNTGSVPRSGNVYFLTGFHEDYFESMNQAYGDLNTRPISMAGYDHDVDFERLELTERPYGSSSWRANAAPGLFYMIEEHLPGTGGAGWTPRDNDHGWFYHVEDYYYASADPWVKDWFQWMGEFRKRTLFRKINAEEGGDPFDYWEWGWGTRAEAHMLANAVACFRVTGDPQLLEGLRNRIQWLARCEEEEGPDSKARGIHRRWGCYKPASEACFQIGYNARALASVIKEVRGHDHVTEDQALLLLWGFMGWNRHISLYSYHTSVEQGPLGSSGTAMSFCDPQAMFYLWTGKSEERELMFQYINGELGHDPYSGPWDKWDGGWEGRTPAAIVVPKPNETAAATIGNLTSSIVGGRVRLEWTTPANADRFMIVYSKFPISSTYTQDLNKRNVWGCYAVDQNLQATPGQRQSLDLAGIPTGQKLYFAVLTFTSDDNMSEASNITSIDVP